MRSYGSYQPYDVILHPEQFNVAMENIPHFSIGKNGTVYVAM